MMLPAGGMPPILKTCRHALKMGWGHCELGLSKETWKESHLI